MHKPIEHQVQLSPSQYLLISSESGNLDERSRFTDDSVEFQINWWEQEVNVCSLGMNRYACDLLEDSPALYVQSYVEAERTLREQK